MFPACADLAKWLVRSGRARRTSEGFCEMCGEQASFEYEGHKACDVLCLADLLDEHGLAERTYVAATEEGRLNGLCES
jgi:hypothetical protein